MKFFVCVFYLFVSGGVCGGMICCELVDLKVVVKCSSVELL